MKKYAYSLEKFEDACHILAVEEGEIRSRLLPVFNVLMLIAVNPEEHLPSKLVKDFQWIISQLTKYPEPDPHVPPQLGREWEQGNVRYTLSRMYNKTAKRIADRIWNIWWNLRFYYNE